MAGTQKTRMKKSSESMVHPKKAATKVWRWVLLRLRKFLTTDRKWSSRDKDIGGRIADRLSKNLRTGVPALRAVGGTRSQAAGWMDQTGLLPIRKRGNFLLKGNNICC